MTLSSEAPDGAGSGGVLSEPGPEEGWMIRKAHQSPVKRGLCYWEDRFMAVDSLA
ncbi:hypothetical protein MJ579_12945 [Klebsiella pneumoniae]|nr:hypothetical protein MJ579_12945 [Klebsiella pneumoniae]